jgi:hypothetical protein
MRDLTSTDKDGKPIIQRMRYFDGRSGTDMILLYRHPTTDEEIEYQNSLWIRNGSELIANAYATRLKFGLAILVGFGQGDFGDKGVPFAGEYTAVKVPAPTPENKQAVAIVINEVKTDDKAYRKDWKDLVKALAHDIITQFAFTIFESSRISRDVLQIATEIKKEAPAKETPFPNS